MLPRLLPLKGDKANTITCEDAQAGKIQVPLPEQANSRDRLSNKEKAPGLPELLGAHMSICLPKNILCQGRCGWSL